MVDLSKVVADVKHQTLDCVLALESKSSSDDRGKSPDLGKVSKRHSSSLPVTHEESSFSNSHKVSCPTEHAVRILAVSHVVQDVRCLIG